MMFKLNQVFVALMLSSSVLPSSHASNLLDGWDCSKCTIENYIGKDYEHTKKEEFEVGGYDFSSEFTSTVANLAKDGSTYEMFVESCFGEDCTSIESGGDSDYNFLPLYTYDKTEDDIRAIYKYTIPVLDDDNNDDDYYFPSCPDVFAVVEIVPLSPDSIEEVDVDSYIGTTFNMGTMMYTVLEDCIFDRMYVNCLCDPDISSAGSTDIAEDPIGSIFELIEELFRILFGR